MCHHFFRKYNQGCDGHERENCKRIRFHSDGVSVLYDAQVEGAACPADEITKDTWHEQVSQGDQGSDSVSLRIPAISHLRIPFGDASHDI